MDAGKRRTFIRGMVLAWLPSIPILWRGIRAASAHYLATLGFGADSAIAFYAIPALPCETAAVFLLLTSFSRKHPWRVAFSALTICWSVLLIGLLAVGISSAISGAF